MTKTQKHRDVVTLADLSPRHDIKGGSQRVFGVDSPNLTWRNEMKTKLKDLPPKSTSAVKGGKRID